jgi:hypothetical protein
MPDKPSYLLFATDVPQNGNFIGASADKNVALRCECDTRYKSCMTGQYSNVIPRRGVPHADAFVHTATCDTPAVGTKGNTQDPFGMTNGLSH